MSKITYLDEIAKELAEEHGLEEKEAMELCKLSIDHAYDLMKNPKVISIRFPSLGVLHFNIKRAKYSYRHSKAFHHLVDIIEKQIELAEKLHKNCKDLAHARRSFYTQFRKYFFPDLHERRRSKKKQVFREIEMKQNK